MSPEFREPHGMMEMEEEPQPTVAPASDPEPAAHELVEREVDEARIAPQGTRQDQLRAERGAEWFEEWEAECDAVIDQKLALNHDSENISPNFERHSTEMKHYVKEILATETMSLEFFDALVDHIVIAQADTQAESGNLMMISASPEHAALILYPRFFSAEVDFDREHAIAHDIGELAYGHMDQEEYGQYKVDPAFAIEGAYVDETRAILGDESADREAFCETFADVIRSQSGMETACRRFLRYEDTSRFDAMMATAEGRHHIDYLAYESMNLRAIILRQGETLLPAIQEEADARRATGSVEADMEDWELALWAIDDDQLLRMAPPPQVTQAKSGAFMQKLFDFFGVK